MFRSMVLALGLMLIASSSFCHTLGTSFLFVSQLSDGSYNVSWQPDSGLKISGQTVALQFPDHCQFRAHKLFCSNDQLRGEVSVANLPAHADVVISVDWGGGISTTELISGAQVANFNPPTSGDFHTPWLTHFRTYFILGIEHILLGIDHLLFVVGLVLLVTFSRKLIWTITAFTVSHSVTLGLSVLGYISVSQSLVEIIIALSILLLALEVLKPGESLSKRIPWLVAFIFGLIHGLGFSGALRAIGLPEEALFSSLLAFNLGVEFGQLFTIAVLFLIVTTAGRMRLPAAYQSAVIVIAGYMIGSAGAYWALTRSMDWLGLV